MNPYLATKYTVPDGYGHPLFSLPHIFSLIFTGVAIIFLSSLYREKDEKGRLMIRRVLALLLLLDEIVKDANAIVTGQWNWNLLPLHLCSVNIFIIAYEAFTDSDVAKNYLYGICIPASISALIFPSWMTVLPYFSLMSMHSWSVHALLFIYPVLLLSGGFIPSWHVFFKAKVIIPFLTFLTFDYFFNYAFGTDFFFLRNGGEDNPLSFFESILPDGLYLALILILLILMVSVMYFINYLVKKARKIE